MSAPSLHSLFDPDAITDDTRRVNAQLSASLAAMEVISDLSALRTAYVEGQLGLPASPKSPQARTFTIPGPGGEIELRVLAPAQVNGVYLHIHGGGWMVGNNDTWDSQLELISRDAGLACVSVNYRLAPEHPFPAAIDDCVAAAYWLIANAAAEFGTSWLAIGGESAGAHLAASTLLRLRDTGKVGAFGAANLMFGCFDLSLTPSVRLSSGTPFVDPNSMKVFVDAFLGEVDPRSPAVSPLYADLSGMPPALFSVGTVDPLLDDSLFMHMRWQAAGSVSELAIYPGGVHGFNSFDSDLALEANRHIGKFLRKAQDADTDR